SMRRFAGLELNEDALPDETTILKFRRLLERHALTAQMINVIHDVLAARGALLKGGTMVDATIIHAPSSIKNASGQRDPMHTTSVTPANVADIKGLPRLLREDNCALFGDKGYVNNQLKRA